ncbi:MAG: peptidyl-prolyl cis-trans isomerase, partial [Acidobacteriaceae bacterium]
MKILLTVIIGAFILILVVTLVPGMGMADWTGGGAKAGVLATVDGRPIATVDVQRAADMAMRQNKIPEQYKAMVMPRVIDQLVTENALLDRANRIGLQVTDQELQAELRTGPLGQALFPNGQYIGDEKYMDFVDSRFRLSVERFQELLKEQLLMEKLQAVVSGPATVSDAEVQQAYAKQNEKVKFAYAFFSTPELEKTIKPTDSELRAFYNQNKAQYVNSIPEKRKLKFAVIDPAKASADISVTPQEVQSYYDSHKQQFQIPERVKVSHILISPKPGPDGKPNDAAAKAKADDILKQIKAGGNFAELAEKNSDDPGSAKQGGSLGFITKGMTVPEFEKAAFALNPGQVSDVVHSSFGYHIIRSDGKEPAHAQSFDEVKAQIEPMLLKQKRAQAASSYVDKIQADVKSEGFDKAAAKFGLNVQSTDPISATDTIPAIGASPEFMQAAFSAEKNTAEVARTAQGYAIVEALDIKPPATPSFEEAKSRVEQEFKSQKASQLLQQKSQELADRAKADKNLQQAAKQTGATYKTSDFVGASDQVPDIGAMSGPAGAVFTLAAGQVSAPASTGNLAFVMQLTDKKSPSAEDFAKAKNQIRAGLLGQKRNQSFALFAAEVRAKLEKDGKIKFNKDE